MKYQNLLALLGLSEIEFHSSGIFGKGDSFAKLSAEQLEKIENTLANSCSKEDFSAMKKDLETAKTELEKHSLSAQVVDSAVAKAMETAGLETGEDTLANIQLLGEKCKEYGESTNRHSFPDNSGSDEPTHELIEGYLDPKDPHNQLLNRLS